LTLSVKLVNVTKMKQIAEAPRNLDVVLETDVLVVGSGPGGLAAALPALR